MNNFSITGNIANIPARKFYFGTIEVKDGRIFSIEEHSPGPDPYQHYIIPGFIDSHVHIESSMLVPSEFARLAVVHGTVATVSDPHEIANVCGMEGVRFMIENGKTVNFKFNFGAPSCVPATEFETAGAVLSSAEVEQLLELPDIRYLSEMMNFPGVINGDPEVMKKIAAAFAVSKPADGHAPGLTGDALRKYVAAGISTDHECFTKEEALEKLALGMKILIREGSAAKNFEALISILNDFPEQVMFCSDDKHPDSLVTGHINECCSRAAAKGIDIFHILMAACINPVQHYRLPVGTLNIDDPADFIVVRDLKTFGVITTYINGECVAENGSTKLSSSRSVPINNFAEIILNPKDLIAEAENMLIDDRLPVIEALDGQLITNLIMSQPLIERNEVVSDLDRDILKLVVVNRYQQSPPAIAFIKNFGLKKGSIASSVAHDSHNIIAVGTNDNDLLRSINLVISNKGGISMADEETTKVLALPVAGLMSADDGYKVAGAYTEMDSLAKSLGTSLSAPYMTLSFMGLLVIPSLKLSDKGLFDGENFRFMYKNDR